MDKLLIAWLIAFSPVVAAKDIYKWTEGGQTYYGDKPQSANAVVVNRPVMVVPRGARVSADTLAADRQARAEKQLAARQVEMEAEKLDLMRETAQKQTETPRVVAAGWASYYGRGGQISHVPTFRGSHHGGQQRARRGGRP
ncbi:MAG: DUF4124 domain-containing protein [Azoarcus sp.]|jgi:hypothetical protein|nr:DUF4124 domain-containing protein [Azoarcus sp.]